MRFAQEFWLYLVPLVPLLWFVFRAADRRTNRRLISLLGPGAHTHIEGQNNRLRSWRRFFLLAGLFWVLLALARPQWGANEVSVTQRGSDIVIALDISNSMLAEDVLPNRMGRAISELSSFLNRLENSRVGLVFFAGSAFVQCPLTLDYGTAEIFLKMAGPDMMSEQGTAIAAALETSRQLLGKDRQAGQKNNFQAILLVTDGEDLEGDWETQAKACNTDGIKVIPVGVGDKGGGLIPAFDRQGRPDGFMKDDEGNVVMTRLDLAALEEMAGIGGGSSFLVGVDGLAGDRLFAELQRLGKRDLEDRRISSYKERFFWPLMLAFICFSLRVLLHARRPNRPHGAFPPGTGTRVAILALMLPLFWSSQAEASFRPVGGDEAMAGRDFYLTGDFEQALDKFEEALIKAPEDPLISLALGETLFQLERYEEAGVEFERALDLTDDSSVKAEALYNRGTSRLAAGETDLAIEDLMSSLQWNPDQSDARHNLEIGLRRLEQEQQQEQEQEDQDQQDQEENEDGEEQEQEKKDQEKNDQQDQDQKDEQENQDQQDQQHQQEEQDKQEEQDQEEQKPEDEQNQEEQQEQQQDQQEAEENPEEMTQEQALQLLKALDRDEEELKRSVQKRLRGGRPKSGKKW